jgi:hypothetical protein
MSDWGVEVPPKACFGGSDLRAPSGGGAMQITKRVRNTTGKHEYRRKSTNTTEYSVLAGLAGISVFSGGNRNQFVSHNSHKSR